MPATPLTLYLREVLGPCTVVAWHRATGAKRVVEVEDRTGARWIGQRIHDDSLWRGELDGYTWWGDHPRTPDPRARSEDLRAMVLSHLPGVLAHQAEPATFEAAGALLRSLHEVRAPVRDQSWLARELRTAEVDRARTLQGGFEVDPLLVKRCLAGIRGVAELEETVSVPTHGDFLPRNWLLDPSGLCTFDFTEAALRPAVHDFARLAFGPCWDRPSLWSALLQGYGRALSAAEEQLLGHQLVLNAVLAIGWGQTRDLAEVRDRGMQVLRRASPRDGTVRPPGHRRRRTRARTSASPHGS